MSLTILYVTLANSLFLASGFNHPEEVDKKYEAHYVELHAVHAIHPEREVMFKKLIQAAMFTCLLQLLATLSSTSVNSTKTSPSLVERPEPIAQTSVYIGHSDLGVKE